MGLRCSSLKRVFDRLNAKGVSKDATKRIYQRSVVNESFRCPRAVAALRNKLLNAGIWKETEEGR